MSALMEAPAMSVIPDSIEPYVGFKYLGIDKNGRLSSPSSHHDWVPREKAICTCQTSHGRHGWQAVRGHGKPYVEIVDVTSYGSTSRMFMPMFTEPPKKPSTTLPDGYGWSWEQKPHADGPDESCTCGFYVTSDEEGCASYAGSGCVLVEVALWGTVVRGEKGARGQFAYPQRIIATDKTKAVAEKAGELYGIPVDLAESDEIPGLRSDVFSVHFTGNVDTSGFYTTSPPRWWDRRGNKLLAASIAANVAAASLNIALMAVR